jgi:hypothetical protein
MSDDVRGGPLVPFGDPLPPKRPGYMTLVLVDGRRYALVEVSDEMLALAAPGGLDYVVRQLVDKVRSL